MREVIALPQVVCGVERYAHTEKRKVISMIKEIVVFHYHCFKFMLTQMIIQKEIMQGFEATQNNYYGGLVITGGSVTINIGHKEKDAEPQKDVEQPTTTEVKAEEKKEDIAAKDEKDLTVREMLYYLVQEAKELFGTPRDILKPYLVAVSMGLIPAMNVNAFNDYFKTNLNKGTFSLSTTTDAINRYSKEELDYYYTKFARYEKDVL